MDVDEAGSAAAATTTDGTSKAPPPAPPKIAEDVTYALDGGRRVRVFVSDNVLEQYRDLFVKSRTHSSKYSCTICTRMFEILGKPGRPAELSASTLFNLKMHIASCCPQELTARDAKLGSLEPIYKSGTTPAPDPAPLPPGQQTLPFARKPRTEEEEEDWATDIALFFLADGLSFNAVSGPGFRRLVKKQFPHVAVRMPSPHTVARRAMDIDGVLVAKYGKEIFPRALGYSDLEGVQDAKGEYTLYSMTCDAWSTKAGDPYLGITIHFIDKDYTLRSIVLALREFPVPHTAEGYTALVNSVVEEFGLPILYMLLMTTDRAAVMLKFARDLELPHASCAAHGLHNAVLADTLDDKEINARLEGASKLAAYFPSTATSRNAAAEKKAKEMGLTYLKPKSACPTRWGSTLRMLMRHLERMPYIKALEPQALNFTKAEEAIYKGVVRQCEDDEPFYRAVVAMLERTDKWTVLLQASKTPTISLLYLAKADIMAGLQETKAGMVAAGETGIARTVVDKLIASVEARLADVVPPVRPPKIPTIGESSEVERKIAEKAHTRWCVVNAARLVDCRTVGDAINDLVSLEEVTGQPAAIDTLINYIGVGSKTWRYEEEEAAAAVPAPSDAGNMAKVKFLATLQKLSDAQAPKEPKQAKKNKKAHGAKQPSSIAASKEVVDEVMRYVATVDLDMAAKEMVDDKLAKDPLDFWRKNHTSFPILAHVARSVLAAQATSAGSERLFSSARIVMGELRGQLRGDTAEACVVGRDALRQMDDDEIKDVRQRVDEVRAARKAAGFQKGAESRKRKADAAGLGTAAAAAPAAAVDDDE